MIERPTTQSGTEQAACRDTDSDSFFPEGPSAGWDAKYAKKLCEKCPIAAVVQCARTALDVNKDYTVTGVWAGQYLGHATRTREEALRALHAIAGVPYAPKKLQPSESWPRPCEKCGRSMRERNARLGDHPDTVKYGQGGRCDTCNRAARRNEPAGAFLKDAVAS